MWTVVLEGLQTDVLKIIDPPNSNKSTEDRNKYFSRRQAFLKWKQQSQSNKLEWASVKH